MALPDWVGIPAAISLLGLILYGFRQGAKVTSRQEGDPPERGD
jgi:hypothetical protein